MENINVCVKKIWIHIELKIIIDTLISNSNFFVKCIKIENDVNFVSVFDALILNVSIFLIILRYNT